MSDIDISPLTSNEGVVRQPSTRREVVEKVEFILHHLGSGDTQHLLLKEAESSKQVAPQLKVLVALAEDDMADAPGHAGRHPEGDRGLEHHPGQELPRGLRLTSL